MEVIVLAGGLGTRLRDEVRELPKCMAPVNGKPFLAYVFNYLECQHADQVILSLGYKHEAVTDWLKTKAFTFKIKWVLEKEPLGTGGGVKRALHKSEEDSVFVINGDTLFTVDLHRMRQCASDTTSKAVLALKPMKHYDRYGSVLLNEEKDIIGFTEKAYREEGLINGGIYLLNKKAERFDSFPDRFSLEKDFLERETSGSLKGYVSDSYFIDIGIPEDYRKAQKELAL